MTSPPFSTGSTNLAPTKPRDKSRFEMKIGRTILVGNLLLLLSTQRSPAPIREETPTPAPEQSAKSKAKRVTDANRSARPAAAASAPSPTPSKRFAGTWTGTTDLGVYGQVSFTVVVDPSGNFVDERSAKFGTHRCSAQREGNTVKWKSGEWFQAGFHTLTPNPDGRTATVTCGNGLLMKTTSTFVRE